MQSPHRDEEASAGPDFSPGVVGDDEQLVRSLFNPDHVVDGKLIDRAISLDDLRRRGFSVHRLRHVNLELVRRSNEKILSRTFAGAPRVFVGVAKLETGAVRAIRIDERQAFVVIDTALPCNAGHASIYAADGSATDGKLRQLRSLLLPLLQDLISLDEAFND